MVKYHNFDVVFAEIPDEVTLAINLTNCPNRCPGCHSPYLRADAGEPLDDGGLLALLGKYARSVTCVCFMGGDAEPQEVARLARVTKRAFPALRTGWYSGRERLPEGIAAEAFDYVKLGGWIEMRGPLTAPGTNQRLYRVGAGSTMTDITERFRRSS